MAIDNIVSILTIFISISGALYVSNSQIRKNRQVQWINDLRDKFSSFSTLISLHKPTPSIAELKELGEIAFSIVYRLSSQDDDHVQLRSDVSEIMVYLTTEKNQNEEQFQKLNNAARSQFEKSS